MTKTDTTTLALYFSDGTKSDYDGPRYSLSLYFVRLDGDKVRNINDLEPWPGFDLSDLRFDADSYRGEMIGRELRYRDVYAVDAKRAESMTKTLRKIDTRLTKLSERFGYPADVSQNILRLADAIGVTHIVFEQSHHGWSYDDNEHRIEPVSVGARVIESRIREALAAMLPGRHADTADVPAIEEERQ